MQPRAAHCARWRFLLVVANWRMTTYQFPLNSQTTYPAGFCRFRNCHKVGLAEHADSTRELGTTWADAMETVLLVVPSTVLPRERNYLINPQHPDFSRITFHEAEPFSFDKRLTTR